MTAICKMFAEGVKTLTKFMGMSSVPVYDISMKVTIKCVSHLNGIPYRWRHPLFTEEACPRYIFLK